MIDNAGTITATVVLHRLSVPSIQFEPGAADSTVFSSERSPSAGKSAITE